MADELELDFVAELLSGSKVKTPTGGAKRRKLIVHKTQYPSATTRYVNSTGVDMRCASRGCSAPTIRMYEGIPYCMIHGEFALAQIIERLENRIQILEKKVG